MSSGFQIEKLDSNNYESWCLQMKSVLIHAELWKIANGESVKPQDANGLEQWISKDEKALATIMLCIKPTQINHIKNCKTSFQAWGKLKEIFLPSGPARKVTLFKQLMQLKMEEDDNVPQFLDTFFGIVEKLAEINVTIVEELVVIILLSSLPKCFESFVVAVETRDVLPTLSMLKVKLLEEGERHISDGKRTDQQAFSASKKKYNQDVNSKKKKGKCFNCGRPGHFASQCRDRNKAISGKSNQKALASYAFGTNPLNKSTWCVDSGATSHMCCDRNMFTSFEEVNEIIKLVGEHSIESKGRGQVSFKCGKFTMNLKNCLYVPNMQGNFISVASAVQNGLKVIFDFEKVIFIEEDKTVILKGRKEDNLFIVKADEMSSFYSNSKNESVEKWHQRYGHVNFQTLKDLSAKNIVYGLNIDSIPSDIVCKICAKSKIYSKPFQQSETRSENCLDIIHSDVCGPMNVKSIAGSRYFITFIDDMSRQMFVYFMKEKSQVFQIFKEFKAMVENQLNRKIKILRTDNGGEYINNEFEKFLKENGINRQLTVPYTPQQNGVAERANRTLVEMARSMIVNANLEEYFWAEAISTAVYIRNRSLTKINQDKTPQEIWSGRKPTVAHFKVFGSTVIALDKTVKKKFKPKGKEYIMVGYSEVSKAYRIYDVEDKKVIVRRDVIFIENEFLRKQDNNERENVLIEIEPKIIENIVNFNENPSTSQASNRNDTENSEEDSEIEEINRTDDFRNRRGRPKLIKTGKPGRPKKQYNNSLNVMTKEKIDIPQTVKEAVSSRYSDKWLEAMKKEYNSLIENNTWTVVQLPKNQKPIGCKWVFSLKENKNGNIERFKARLVAKGCSQKYGINYEETFSPVIRYANLRLLFAIAVEEKLYMHQMDVKTAYLNGDLHDDVYMKMPEYFEADSQPNTVLKLKKSLYGLKQSGREWNFKLNNVLKELGFVACPSEPCLYTRHHNEKLNYIAVYVDDIIVASSDKNDLSEIKKQISSKLNIVDKGPLSYFLGMEIERDGETGSITLCQKNYIKELLHEYNMEECKPMSTPLNEGFQLKCSSDNCDKVNETEYQSLIGTLMYLALTTRADILHSVCKLSQRNKNPHTEHVAAAKHILRYLSKTRDFKLNYHKTGKPIEGFVDADWGGDPIERKSYTGYIFLYAGCIFSWESKKQATVALSSTEAEYIAFCEAAKEAVYLRKICLELGIKNLQEPVVINGDNLSAQQLIKNPVYHARSKHIDIKYHYVRDVYNNKDITLKYVPTNDMLADLLTKNLGKTKHYKFTDLMGLF